MSRRLVTGALNGKRRRGSSLLVRKRRFRVVKRKRRGLEDYFLNVWYFWAALGSRFFNRSEACFLSSKVDMPS